MAIDVPALAQKMLGAALPWLGKGASDVEHYTAAEMTKLAQTVAGIEAAAAAGKMNADTARILLEMQKVAAQSVLTTAEGLGIVAVEQAINAALAVAKDALGVALKWVL